MFELEGSKVLVTGGAGHIGSHIVDAVLAEGASRILIFDNFAEGNSRNLQPALQSGRAEVLARDIRDYEDLEVAMKGVDFVFHTASIMLLEARMRPAKAIETNINGTFNVLQAAAKCGVQKVVFSSTGSVYGEPLYLPMDENHPYNNETIYGATKIAGEQFCRNFHREHGLAFVALRYFNVYGPRQHTQGAYAQIVPRWYDLMSNERPITIFGDGSQTMDMTFVQDVARANVLAAESSSTAEFFNVGTGNATSVLQVFQYLKELFGYNLQPVFEQRDVNLVKRRQCSTEKAERLLGFKAEVAVKDGLQAYVDWREQIARGESLALVANVS
jgi:nucleoside-diphosphate-sugar epimerase